MLKHRHPRLQDLTWERPESRSDLRIGALVIALGLAIAMAAIFFAEHAARVPAP